jgi:hypothetical protein
VCKSYQSRWKHHLQFYATFAGLVTVVIALVTYIAATAPEIRRTLCWQDRVSVTLNSGVDTVVLSNFGDGDIFAHDLKLASEEQKFHQSSPINILVKAKSFASTSFLGQTGQWGTVPLRDDKEWQKLRQDVECFHWVFYDRHNPDYETLQKSCGEGLRTFPADGLLIFFSGHDGNHINLEIPIYAVGFFNVAEECMAKYGRFGENGQPCYRTGKSSQ